jgi:hypothetical protein
MSYSHKVLFFLVIVFAALSLVLAIGINQSQATPHVTRWEYRCVNTENSRNAEKWHVRFNKLGEDGWQMSGMTDSVACFKRTR